MIIIIIIQFVFKPLKLTGIGGGNFVRFLGHANTIKALIHCTRKGTRLFYCWKENKMAVP